MRRRVLKRSEISAQSYDPTSELGEGHALGEAGGRYRSELDFEAGLPQPEVVPMNVEDDDEKPAQTYETESDSEEGVPNIQASEPAPAPVDPSLFKGHVLKALSWEAVRSGWLPEDDHGGLASGLPASLEADVPPRYRYWKAASKDEALRVREALVEEGLFDSRYVLKVNGELRRAVTETAVRLFLSPEYDDAEPVVVPPVCRAVEKAAGLLSEDGGDVTLFDQDVTEIVGIETILEKAAGLSGDWIVAAKDSPENRKAFGSPVFRLKSRADLIFATSAELADPDSVEWVVHSREDEVIKFAFGQGRKIPLLKDAGEERIVFGIVLEPNTVDSQNDTIDAETIQKAAHRFMEEFGNLGLQHKEIVNGKLKLLESYIAPVDFKVNGQKVKAGTWLMKERVVDDLLWKAVKAGNFTGFSIGGSGIRKPA